MVPPDVVPRAQGTGNRGAIEAVVFDFGGVLITSITNQVGDIAVTHGVDTSVMLEVLLGPRESDAVHPWHRAERGEIAVADIQDSLAPWAHRHGISLRGDEIERVMVPGGYTVIDDMLGRIRALRAEGYRTGLLTNTFSEFRPTMERDIPFELFDAVVESFAVGARKPERAIYETARDMLGVEHDAIVYLDDFDQNLAEPRALGWSVIQVSDPDTALADLDRVLSGG